MNSDIDLWTLAILRIDDAHSNAQAFPVSVVSKLFCEVILANFNSKVVQFIMETS